MDDPNYESKSWAKWHPSNTSILPEESEEERDENEMTIEQQMKNLSQLESNSMENRHRNNHAETERFENLMAWFG